MSKLTNKTGLPDIIERALQYDNHKVSGDFSVTQIIDAPQILHLKRKYKDILEHDVSEGIFALLGTACHEVLSRANISDVRQRAFMMVIDTLREHCRYNPDNIFEKKNIENYNRIANELTALIQIFFPEIVNDYLWEKTMQITVQGRTLYGTFDLYHIPTKTLIDYKVVSVWAFIFPESKKKFYAQLNTYAFMLEQEGYEVKQAQIVMLFRDFSKTEQMRNKDYPLAQIITVDIPLYSMEIRQQYIESRMTAHIQAELGNVAPCNGKDMWSKADEWAFMPKPGAKRAVARFDTEASALKFKMEQGHNYISGYVEKRQGTNVRCDSYCPVSSVCQQRADYLNINKK